MASTYSPLLRLELVGAGEQSGLWGETTNKNVGTLLEQAIAGVSTVSLSGGAGTYTLSALNGTQDEARSAVLKFIGNPSGEKIIEIPAREKLYVARNQSGQKIIFKTPAQISNPLLGGVELLDGESSLVFCDGNLAVAGIQTQDVGTLTVAGGGTGVTSFTGGFVRSPGGTGALTSTTSVNLANTDTTGILPITKGGTGRDTLTSGAVLVGNGTSAVNQVAGTLSGQVLTWSGSTWGPSAPVTGITTVTATAPVTASVVGTSAAIALAGGSQVGQVLTWSGSAWAAQLPAASGVTSFNSRTGAVIPQAGDYSGFYPSLTGSGASGTWGISITGNAATATSATTATTANTANSATTATSATTASSASSVPFSGVTSKPTTLSGYGITDAVNLSGTQTITGGKTFSFITAQAYNFAAFDSIFLASGNVDIAIGNVIRSRVFNNGNYQIFGSTASKPGGGTWADSSDARLKTDVQPLQGALAKITALNPVAYQWKYENPNSPTVGFIAQEVSSVLPDAISEAEPTDAQKPFIPEGEKVLNIGWKNDMTAYLVGAIKELKSEIDVLKAELAALK